MIQQAIQRLVDRQDLSEQDATAVMNQIMSGEATPSQIASFITALRMKGETVDEVAGLIRVMRDKATPIKTTRRPLVDTCGTGGDGSHTFNISTASAFVVSGAGAAVAKHGNRAASSKCGSADVLKELGVNVDADPATVGKCVDEVGIGFLFALNLHGAMKHAIGPRREIGVRTVFNILGPTTNPAGATRQLIGVFDGAWTEPIAHALGNLGSERALIVHGSDGLDELTTTGPSRVSELHDGDVTTYDLDPRDFDVPRASEGDLKGGEADENARILLSVLNGESGPQRDIVILNAAGALIAAGLTEDFPTGLNVARESIDSGAAKAKLEQLVLVSNSGA